LLDFLSNSFAGGGTDVTAALRHAMTVLMGPATATTAAGGRRRNSNNNGNGDDDETATSEMAAADLLLITDGEIPDPPVDAVMMEQLNRLKQRTGMEIHGLLVGNNGQSKALDQLCTQTHDFLIGYSGNVIVKKAPPQQRSTMALSARRPAGGTTRMASRMGWSSRVVGTGSPRHHHTATTSMRARKFDSDDVPTTNRGGNRQKQIYDVDDDFSDETWRDYSADDTGRRYDNASPSSTDSFNVLVDDALERIRIAVAAEIEDQTWQVSVLEKEKDAAASWWRYREQFRDAVARVSENLVERDEESRLVVLGMAAGEHVLFLGPPGTGKSALGRRLSKICGGLFFQRLLTRFTTPEEIFGPLSLRALENDEYKRCTDGFLPKASVAFLDEIFKANSAILNTLLTILNERQFDNGAGRRENCPIRCVIAASNELPESEELDALYDRFLLRKEVLPVSDLGLVQMLGLATPGSSSCDGPSDGSTTVVHGPEGCDVIFAEGLDVAVDSVQMGNEVCFLFRDLRTFMRDEMDVDISDRRLVKASRLLKVSAASHGRTRVDPIDCLLLQHMAWRLPEQRGAVREWLWENLTPGSVAGGESTVSQFNLLLNSLRQEALAAVRKASGDVTGAAGARESDVVAIQSIRGEISQLACLLQQQSEDLARHIELLRRSMDHLWLDPDEARAAQQLLIPKAEVALRETNLVLGNARSLYLALNVGSSASPSDEVRLPVIEQLWDDENTLGGIVFTEVELSISMKEAKAKYDGDIFRRWKKERRKAGFN
jgi:MoxR-like ATPase